MGAGHTINKLLVTILGLFITRVFIITMKATLNQDLADNYRTNLISKFLEIPLNRLKKYSIGSLTAEVYRFCEMAENLSRAYTNLVCNGFISIVILVYIFIVNKIVTMLLLIHFFVTVLFLCIKRNSLGKYEEIYKNSVARLSSFYFETILGIKKIITSGAEMAFRSRFSHLNQCKNAHFKSLIQFSRWRLAISSFCLYFATLSVFCAFILTSKLGNKPQDFLSTESILVVILSNQVIYFIFSIISNLNVIINLTRSYNKLSKIDIGNTNLVSYSSYHNGPKLSGEICVRNLCFSYKLNKPLITNLNLAISAGKIVGIIGKTGSGKSTLIKLLTGLHIAENGSILFDNLDIKKYKKEILKQIGVVFQNQKFMSATIKELFGHIAEKESLEIIDTVDLVPDFNKLPYGLNTSINANGSGLSGGQRQKLLIAMALSKHPAIMILDEAMSSIDYASKVRIINNLKKLSITVVIIEHDLKQMSLTDAIYLLDAGSLKEVQTKLLKG
jgi:ABC-type bacteriocin/lantibiotic exporter with double-glycine peptidase domain